MEQIIEAQELIEEISVMAENARDKRLCRALHRLLKKLRSELKQLHKQEGKTKPTSNLPHLKGILQMVKNSTGVQEVICDLKKYGIVIDVICDNGRTWKKVVARNAQSTHLIWAGKGQYGTKDVTKTVRKYLRSAEQFCEFYPPRIVCIFCNGVTRDMAQYMEGLGVSVEGERVDVDADTLRRLQALEDLEESEGEFDSMEDLSDDEDLETDGIPSTDSHNSQALEVKNMDQQKKIFLDVTSMVIYVSDVCNGGASFKFKDTIMAEQAVQELETPVMPIIQEFIESRMLVTCATALENFKENIDARGGADEKKRAIELVKKLTVVPDLVSDRFLKLKTGGKVRIYSSIQHAPFES